jgi:hypothetical protein
LIRRPAAIMPARRSLLLAAGFVLAAGAGCAGTRITSAWQDPALRDVPFRKVLVVFQNRDPDLRRIVEDEMAREIPGSVPAYQVIRDAELRDIPKVKERVRELGFDSSVIMRVAGVARERTYVPGQIISAPGDYRGLWGYWGYGWAAVYEPAYLRDDRVVRIAANVYAVQADKLVWASESETFNPASIRSAVGEAVEVTAKAAARAMRGHG